MGTMDNPSTDAPVIFIEDDEPTDEQLQIAFHRAKKEFGDCVADYESEAFETEFADQLNLILNEEAIGNLVEKGLMEVRVRDDGHLGYAVTSTGEAVLGAL
jgi:hypothetical protein